MDAREKKILGLEDVPVIDRTCDDELVYIRQSDCCTFEHPSGGRLIVHGAVEDVHIEWALLDCVSSQHSDGSPDQYEVAMHGSGVGSSLREARHTYFGEKGYIYYVNPALLAWAFGCLREWFDFDGEERS